MQPNTLLDALLDEAGVSHAGLATRVNRAGRARDSPCVTNTPPWRAG